MGARQAAAVTGLLALVAAGCTAPADRPGATPAPGGTSGSAERQRVEPAEVLEPALEEDPVRPATPQQAAEQLAAAHRAIHDPTTAPEVLAAAAHTQQLAYRELADRPGWDERVTELLPGTLVRDARDNVAARRAFRSMFPGSRDDLASELPAWRIVTPRPAGELRRYYREAERRYGIDWEYLAAINLVETGFGRIDGTSVAGAQGPMQFIPTTWDIYGRGGDIEDPRDSILAAGRLLRANGFARDRSAALFRYNNAEAYVRGVTLYARVMQRRPRAYLGYHQWPVYYLTRAGSIWLPEGYAQRRPVPVKEWLARS